MCFEKAAAKNSFKNRKKFIGILNFFQNRKTNGLLPVCFSDDVIRISGTGTAVHHFTGTSPILQLDPAWSSTRKSPNVQKSPHPPGKERRKLVAGSN